MKFENGCVMLSLLILIRVQNKDKLLVREKKFFLKNHNSLFLPEIVLLSSFKDQIQSLVQLANQRRTRHSHHFQEMSIIFLHFIHHNCIYHSCNISTSPIFFCLLPILKSVRAKAGHFSSEILKCWFVIFWETSDLDS